MPSGTDKAPRGREFVLDTTGAVREPQLPSAFVKVTRWTDLDPFTQGYIEALFFTSEDDLGMAANGHLNDPVGFSDLAPETLARIIADCAKFQDGRAWADTLEGHPDADEEHAGRDFWYTRQGHGCGFWDGDWPEPYATALTEAAEAFPSQDVYLGDDGKVYLS